MQNKNNNSHSIKVTQLTAGMKEEDIPEIIRLNKYPCPFCTLMLHVLEKFEENNQLDDLDEQDKHFFLYHLRKDHGLDP